LPVLAETTSKITSRSGDGKRARPREEMIKRFFFYGVDVSGNEFSIGMSIEDTSSILPNVTDAKFSVGDEAMVAAQEAGNLIFFHLFI
jgi:hypothetical protein